MIAELLTWVQAGAAIGVVTAIAALLTMIVKTAPTWRKVNLDGDAGLRADMRREIDVIRQEARTSEAKCREEIGHLTGQVFLLGRALFLVTGEAEGINPNSVAVAMAKRALQEAFPLQPLPHDIAKMAADLDRGKRDV